MDNQGKLKKNLPLLIILTLSGSFIYSLPYLRSYYYEAFLTAFSLTNTEVGLCGTYYGLFGAVSYLIGGVIADKVSIKKLIPFSMILTGLAGFYLLTIPSPFVIALIHGLWGITSLMTFWPALLKAIRMLAASNEQGKAFGIFEGGRGISNAAYLGIAVIIFGFFATKGGNVLGIQGILLFYSIATVGLGIVSILFLRNITEEYSEEGNSFNFKAVGSVLKMPAIWIMIGIVFCTYSTNVSYYYISPYATAAFGASTLFAAILSSSSQYIRPFSAVGAGILGDRINSSKSMLIGQLIMLAGWLVVMFTPASFGIRPIILACVLIFCSMYICQSMHFAIMEESNIPPEVSGTAIGIVCCIGYLPEAICPYVAGVLIDNYAGLTGYHYFFIFLAVLIVLGVALNLLWLKITKAKRAEILAINRSKREKEKEQVAS